MPLFSSMRLMVGALALPLVAACSGGGSGASISQENPGFFSARVKDSVMSGAYNSNGFTTAQVRSLASQTCDGGRLTGFNTQAREDGLIGFVATCGSWIEDARAVEYEKTGGSNVLIEITGVVSGSLTYRAIEAKI